jgi:hypothetical protein
MQWQQPEFQQGTKKKIYTIEEKIVSLTPGAGKIGYSHVED